MACVEAMPGGEDMEEDRRQADGVVLTVATEG